MSIFNRHWEIHHKSQYQRALLLGSSDTRAFSKWRRPPAMWNMVHFFIRPDCYCGRGIGYHPVLARYDGLVILYTVREPSRPANRLSMFNNSRSIRFISTKPYHAPFCTSPSGSRCPFVVWYIISVEES